MKRIIFGIDWSFINRSGYLRLGLEQNEWNVLAVGLILVVLVDVLNYARGENFVIGKLIAENTCAKYLIFGGLFVGTLVYGIYGAGFEASSFIYRGF